MLVWVCLSLVRVFDRVFMVSGFVRYFVVFILVVLLWVFCIIFVVIMRMGIGGWLVFCLLVWICLMVLMLLRFGM